MLGSRGGFFVDWKKASQGVMETRLRNKILESIRRPTPHEGRQEETSSENPGIHHRNRPQGDKGETSPDIHHAHRLNRRHLSFADEETIQQLNGHPHEGRHRMTKTCNGGRPRGSNNTNSTSTLIASVVVAGMVNEVAVICSSYASVELKRARDHGTREGAPRDGRNTMTPLQALQTTFHCRRRASLKTSPRAPKKPTQNTYRVRIPCFHFAFGGEIEVEIEGTPTLSP